MISASVGASAYSLLQGRYRLNSLIGRGGKATVYRAHDELLGRDVAVKLFTAPPTDAADVARQKNELQILASLNHHSLVSLLDAGVEHHEDPELSRTYLVMELVTGDTLKAKNAQRRLSKRQISMIGLDLAEGLEYMHHHGVVHRDIKPSNILMVEYVLNDRRTRAKLADFGIAVLVEGERWEKDAGSTGTAAYLSPEQARGVPLGPASDVYSLGLVLLECFTGEVAFAGSLIQSAVARLLRDPVIPSHIPREWRQMLTGMTAREPGDRPYIHDVILFLRQAVRLESARHRATESSAAVIAKDGRNTPSVSAHRFSDVTIVAENTAMHPADTTGPDLSEYALVHEGPIRLESASSAAGKRSLAAFAATRIDPVKDTAKTTAKSPLKPALPVRAANADTTTITGLTTGTGTAAAPNTGTSSGATGTLKGESQRMKAVRRYAILDSAPDAAFDRITALAARILATPVSVISIVDSDRIWFKSHHGLDLLQVDRAPGLCDSAILHNTGWVIEDAKNDDRSTLNPLVAGTAGVRFYAGVPLRTGDGHNLGTLSVIDFAPRSISPDDMATLEDLGAMVMSQLELHRVSRRNRRGSARPVR
ncbi:MAG: serine/threonine protein kinase [Glaciihabitans sp.]|nr:serine/threonine protein kinase [Glaciihabitans sp.]